MDGLAKDIGFGGGKLWIIGTTIEGGGYSIYRRDGNYWSKISGSALRITVDDDGNAYVVNNSDYIYRYNGSGWIKFMDGAAKDIGFGGGKLWILGTGEEEEGYEIFRRDGDQWTKIEGSGVKIDVNDDGNAMLVDKFD